MTKDMTAGKPLGLILRFCGPMVFGNILQQLYSMVDTVIVGRYLGASALAGVGATGYQLSGGGICHRHLHGAFHSRGTGVRCRRLPEHAEKYC